MPWSEKRVHFCGIHITDEAGFGVHQRQFEPFGSVAREDFSEATPQTFGTHRLDVATGLYYMKARWYDPVAGRFLSRDPVVRNAFAPQSVNGYSYVENDPTSRIDPLGLQSCPTEDWRWRSRACIWRSEPA